MAFKGNKLKQVLLDSLKDLHRLSSAPAEDQWFRRSEIARNLRMSSEHLNPARVNKLEELVKLGQVVSRQRPDDGRDLPQYRLP
ncbi:MAG TPA: hypothetical protein VHL11_07210 [Phototrophicaceae bacterium]|jgi:hypothetical protein|nr:hypothetical protein [Phototrophicaceae bacterium]